MGLLRQTSLGIQHRGATRRLSTGQLAATTATSNKVPQGRYERSKGHRY